MTTTRTYRALLDAEDRTVAVGPPFLLLDGRTQPAVSRVAGCVAIAFALRDLNAGVNVAVRFPEVVRETTAAKASSPPLI